jgi:hypothetical protein
MLLFAILHDRLPFKIQKEEKWEMSTLFVVEEIGCISSNRTTQPERSRQQKYYELTGMSRIDRDCLKQINLLTTFCQINKILASIQNVRAKSKEIGEGK